MHCYHNVTMIHRRVIQWQFMLIMKHIFRWMNVEWINFISYIYIYFILNYFKLFRSRRFSVIYIFLKITYTKLLVQESLQCLNFQLADQLTSTMYFSSLAET